MSQQKTEEERISPDELKAVQGAKMKIAYQNSLVEKALAEYHSAELELQNFVLKLYIKYGMNLVDSINESDGSIVRKKEEINEET